jgi:hypothetical protein
MDAASSSETPVSVCQITQRHIPEVLNLIIHRDKNLRSHIEAGEEMPVSMKRCHVS